MVLSSPKMVSLSATSAFYPLHIRLHCFTLKRQSFSVCDGRFFRSRISSSIPPHFLGDGHMVQSESHDQYAVASKVETFLEEKLDDALTEKPGNIHQIVLLTDSGDLTPYQLQCPPFTVIFHVSMYPTTRDLEVPKSCLVRYVYGELERCVGSEGWTDKLQRVGYQGNKPSIWLLQGLNFNAENKFRQTIENISGQIMKGSLLIGGLNANIGGLSGDAHKQLLEKILIGNGFRIKSNFCSTVSNRATTCLFVAEQLRLSDVQVENAKREMDLAEESGDEDTFEDWL